MAPTSQIVVDPETPRLGQRVTLSLMIGESVPEDVQVTWRLIRRDDRRWRWPHRDQGRPTVVIRRWRPQDHATYSARTESGDHHAVRTIPAGIRVALSGGGYRASLFGLGTLLYLVDAKAAYRIEDISSVSGGSITNAFVCHQCDLSQTTSTKFWPVVENFAAHTTRRWLIPRRRISLRTQVTTVGIFLVSVLAAMYHWLDWRWTVFALALVYPLRGFLLFETILRFRFGLSRALSYHRRRVSHVFCSTDLEAGEPFYFLVTRLGGFFFSRQRGICSTDYPIAKAVRASAAYPFAFLPKRVRLPIGFLWSSERGKPTQHNESQYAFCADGGVSNNFGTQWFEENDPNDWPYRQIATLQRGTCKPARTWHPAREIVELTIDASGPLPPRSQRIIDEPVIGEIASLVRTTSVLYQSSLTPRRSLATWEQSEINNEGYEALVDPTRDSGETHRVPYLGRRGAHRRTLIPLDPILASDAKEPAPGPLGIENSRAWRRGTEVMGNLARAGMPSDAVAECLTAGRQIPTTLFKLSRAETSTAILSGYIAALINGHRYEALEIPANLEETIARIRTLA